MAVNIGFESDPFSVRRPGGIAVIFLGRGDLPDFPGDEVEDINIPESGFLRTERD